MNFRHMLFVSSLCHVALHYWLLVSKLPVFWYNRLCHLWCVSKAKRAAVREHAVVLILLEAEVAQIKQIRPSNSIRCRLLLKGN